MDNELGNPEWIGSARSFLMNIAAAKTDDALRLLARIILPAPRSVD